ncbi:MAG: diphosphate--fructose-6-phosphate 1-phosphotransferase [Prevotellaceae bacterium]|jgi:pyrophosphate--fructose-6-phosphate 1-phosphotransferase|nr:diphosphate--fructose-6-phosphate 1-phosphotransferase [Prevotellaceae bacterium]
MKKSPLQIARAWYMPKMPKVLQDSVVIREGEKTQSAANQAEIKKLFPNTYGMPLIYFEKAEHPVDYPQVNVGVILSGGQAPGGHNVIAGLYDGLKRLNSNSKLYGFIGGPSGLIEHKVKQLNKETIDEYRNTGGFDIIGSGRTKLEKEKDFDKGIEICKQLNINAIVIIGGDDSNTNACILAEYYKRKNCGIQVIGCPKTIDGDLKNEMIETSFGFDTACKVYSELIGNIQRDANSAKKYWHFIRLMGRSASHISLECALQTQPNVAIISEEVEAKNLTLEDIVENITKTIVARANAGLNFGTILIPEGLIEFVPAIKKLIAELNDLLAEKEDENGNKIINIEFAELATDDEKRDYVKAKLTDASREVFRSLPKGIARQLMLDRDPHGNVQVSLIETEKLLIEMVGKRLAQLKAEGTYKGKFSSIGHFFGYEGRCAIPSNFDADYTYSLGFTAALLIAAGKTGYMASVRNLTAPATDWVAGGVPITMLFNMERRNGELKPVIQKALADLNGAPFKFLEQYREQWANNELSYVYPGPIQYFGPAEVCDQPTRTLMLEKGKGI